MNRVTIVSVLCLFGFGSVSPALADPVLLVDPVSISVALGEEVSFSIKIEDVVDLYAFQFDIGYDATLLTLDSLTTGSFFAGDNFFAGLDDGVGTISFIANTLIGPVSGITGTGTLATLTFQTLATGTSAIIIQNGLLLGSADDPFGPGMPFASTDGTVSITSASSVPAPAPLLLFLAGLAGIALVSRRVPTSRALTGR